MGNTNFQTIHQMGNAVNNFIKQATGREDVNNIDIEHVTVAQNHRYENVNVSGHVVSFTAGEAGIALEKCVVQIEPVQDLHGYENPWPAGGGKNLLSPPETPNARVTGDGKIVMSGTATGNVDAYSNTLKDVTLVAGTTYTISLQGSKRFRLRAFIHDKTNNNYINIGQLNASYYATYTPSADVVINGILFRAVSGETFDVDAYYQLEVGSTASAYAPYANLCPISGWTMCNVNRAGQNMEDVRIYRYLFPSSAGTVYGGTLTIHQDGSGELVVEYKYYENAGTGNWGEVTSGGNRWWIGGITQDAVDSDTTGVCNIGKLISTYYGNGVCVSNNGRINLCGSLYSAFSDVNTLKAYLADHPLQLVYKLATPITYQLTNQQVIETLKGVNNIWADTGDIEIKFTDVKELY